VPQKQACKVQSEVYLFFDAYGAQRSRARKINILCFVRINKKQAKKLY